jgi:iron(III) transport system ATP-binding protein
MTTTSAAAVSGLDKTFRTKERDVCALRDIDLEIGQGEYVVVLGPSGCGKTTLIRCIAGLESPTSGRIELGGQAVFDDTAGIDAKPNKRDVGLLFQNYALWPHMTVAKNVDYPLRMHKVPRGERPARVAEVLEALECSPLANRLPAELSGGQQQRVALARALVFEPSIILLDEPLSNLDALLRVSLRAELSRLHRKLGFTAIHITHDQEEALEMGDRVVLMREGAIEQIGTPKDVYARPVSPYAANFLGVRNRIDVTSGGGVLTYAGGTIGASGRLASLVGDGDGQVFVREQDVRVGTETDPPGASDLTLRGVVAQVVLGPGGKPRLIVEVAGKSWFAASATSAEIAAGDAVIVGIAAEHALLYRDGALVEAIR